MDSKRHINTNTLLRSLPKMDELLADAALTEYFGLFSRDAVTAVLRAELEQSRTRYMEEGEAPPREEQHRLLIQSACRVLDDKLSERLHRVINATGIIIHTNLGRAPLPRKAAKRLGELASSYVNLEYSVVTGERRSRLAAAEDMLCQLTGAEAALIVNNNAAAVFLALNTLAESREVILSRGEIVEIGDSFRVSEIMKKSGALIREVGATNITKMSDYVSEINSSTAMLLKVHTSNFRVTGFTKSVEAKDLASAAKEYKLISMEDMGSGVFADLAAMGLPAERQVREAIADGLDIVTISGDKLLGGPQAGILLGKRDYISRIRRNQLTRCMRIGRLGLIALESVLLEYISGSAELPVMQMAALSTDELRSRAELLAAALNSENGLRYEIRPHEALFGGGSMPGQSIESIAVAILDGDAAKLERKLRALPVPIIAVAKDNAVLLDLRTISPDDFEYITREINRL